MKIKRFEKWFWTTSKTRWIDSSGAASFLARKYMAKVRKDMSWAKTTADLQEKVRSSPCIDQQHIIAAIAASTHCNMAQADKLWLLAQREAMQLEAQAKMAQTKQDIDEAIQNPVSLCFSHMMPQILRTRGVWHLPLA